MSLDADVGLLKSSFLFAGFSGDHLRLLAFGAEREQFAAGTTLIEAGGEDHAGFVIAEGSVEIADPLRSYKPKRTAGAGTLVGEMGMVAGASYSASVTASTDVEVLRISHTLLFRTLEEYPQAAAQLKAAFEHRLRSMCEDLESVKADIDRD